MLKYKMELIAKGAESNLYRNGEILIKERIKKEYRIKEIDERLRKRRTASEGRILKKLKNGGINVPDIVEIDEKNFKIFMKFIDGELMKNINIEDEKNKEKFTDIAMQLGVQIAKMHRLDVIHNDLTTSNVIISYGSSDSTPKVYIIDFGLSIISQRDEDKATDLVVLEHSLNVTGFRFLFESIKNGYREEYKNFGEEDKVDKIFERLKEIKKRVRYFVEEE